MRKLTSVRSPGTVHARWSHWPPQVSSAMLSISSTSQSLYWTMMPIPESTHFTRNLIWPVLSHPDINSYFRDQKFKTSIHTSGTKNLEFSILAPENVKIHFEQDQIRRPPETQKTRPEVYSFARFSNVKFKQHLKLWGLSETIQRKIEWFQTIRKTSLTGAWYLLLNFNLHFSLGPTRNF